MKKLKITLGLIMVLKIGFGQTPWVPATNYLDINNVKATISSDGVLFEDTISFLGFEVPKGSGKKTISNANLWIGGLDSIGQINMAAQNYRALNGPDYFAGPLPSPDNVANWNSLNQTQWNKVWKINKTTIDSFNLGLYNQIPFSILSWPANGDTTNGLSQLMAPFVDLNANGIYEPINGDYPNIRGDQALYFIYNDKKDIHHASGAQAIGLEIHGMAYEFTSANNSINNTVFVNYQIINKSNIRLQQASIANWVDFDLGNYADDYVGTDVTRNAIYVYNGDSLDDGSAGYGLNPPVQSLVILKGPKSDPSDATDNNHDGFIDELNEYINLSGSIYYNNNASLIGEPITALDYYNYINLYWKDTTQLEYYGNGWPTSGTTNGIKCLYVYPNDSDPVGWGTNFVAAPIWNETIAGNTPYDRRMLGISGEFTFLPREIKTLDVAYTTSFGNNGVQSSLDQSKIDIDSVQSFFNNNYRIGNDISLTTKEIKKETSTANRLTLFPNPTSSTLNLQLQGLKIKSINVFDITGKLVKSIDKNEMNIVELNVADLSNGLYLIKASDGKNVYTEKFVKE